MNQKEITSTETLHPQVPTNTAPAIVEQYTNDEDIEIYILGNGNEIPKIKYDALWNKPKGKVLPKCTKGIGLDGRTNWL